MSDFLSARGRNALARHQREVVNHLRELQAVDRVLSGALSACDGATQRETFENYLETVQELRVSLQRLEGFLLQKLTTRHGTGAAEDTDPLNGAGGHGEPAVALD